MKKLFYLIALGAMVASCSESSNEVLSDSTVDVSVDVAMGVDSRISIDSSSENWTSSWEENDALSAVDNLDNVSAFSMAAGGYSASSSTFSGTINGSASTFRLIYPYEASSVTDNKYPISIFSQDGTMNYNYMISEDINVSEASSVSPVMKHIGAFIKFSMSSFEVGFIDGQGISESLKVTSVTVSTKNKEGGYIMPRKATIDLSKSYNDSDLLTTTNTGGISAYLSSDDFDPIDTEALDVYFNILPFTVPAEGYLEFTIWLKDANNSFYGTIETTTTAEGFTFERGKYYEFSYTPSANDFTKFFCLHIP